MMDTYRTNEKTTEQVDIGFLLKIFKTSFIHILIVGFLCAGLAGGLKYFTTTPTYTSSGTFYINAVTTRSSDGESIVAPGSTAAARDLAETFTQVIKSNMVIDMALDMYLHDQDQFGDKYLEYTTDDIRAMISVTVNAQILRVEVTHPDQKIAYEVADALVKVIPGRLDYCVGIKTEVGGEGYESVAKCLDTAKLDMIPSGRGLVVFALIGFVLGVALVFTVAFLRAFFDNTVYTEEDLKAYFTLPVIGQIPTWNNANDGNEKKKRGKKVASSKDFVDDSGVPSVDRDYTGRLLSKETPFAIAEAFKLLRTNLCYTTKGEDCAVFGITSAYVGAGKSTLVANTAISFAEMGKRVLLLDGDLRCPVQHRVFNLDPKSYGLSEILAGVCKNDTEAIRPSGINNLDVVTSGRIPPNPAELLASAKLRSFIEEAKKNYDVIFIDLPPICEVSDAGVISDVVTGYSFVVRAAYSDRRLIGLALETLESLGSSMIGFILNDVDIKSGDYYKNKYYGYGKDGKIGNKYGKYDKSVSYGYHRRDIEYRYGYSEEEIGEQNLEKTHEEPLAGKQSQKPNSQRKPKA